MLVVDCSVAVKWFLEEPGDREALALLRTGERLIAPELIVAELVNVLWKRVTTGAIGHSQAADVPQAIPTTLAELCPLAPLAARALAIAGELRHPAYDCFYLALAETRDLKTDHRGPPAGRQARRKPVAGPLPAAVELNRFTAAPTRRRERPAHLRSLMLPSSAMVQSEFQATSQGWPSGSAK